MEASSTSIQNAIVNVTTGQCKQGLIYNKQSHTK